MTVELNLHGVASERGKHEQVTEPENVVGKRSLVRREWRNLSSIGCRLSEEWCKVREIPTYSLERVVRSRRFDRERSALLRGETCGNQ